MNAPMTKAEAIAAGDVRALVCSLRAELGAGVNNIPADLKKLKGWLAYRVSQINPDTGKFDKIPIYPCTRKQRHGEQGSDADMASLGTWDEVQEVFKGDTTIAGVGFAMLPRFGMVALDVDHCIEGGNIRSDAERLTDVTYCEISPSGTGIRAFWHGEASDGKNNDAGFELFHTTGFVTVTGNQVANAYALVGHDSLPLLSDDMRVTLEALSTATGKVGKLSTTKRLKEAAENDQRLQAIKDKGLYERDMGSGKHSIMCPREAEHSDVGRRGGDGDTVYFQPNTNGYTTGYIFCTHTHDNDQTKYWEILGFDELAGEFENLDGGCIPLQIPDDLPPVPPFDLELLPEVLCPWITDIAERMQISPDIPAIGAVTALSSAIGRRVQIMPKAQDDWTVVPNLWGLVVAPPGYMKSPALSAVMAPLHRLESDANRLYESAMAAWALEKEHVKLRNRANEQIAVAKHKKGDSDIPELLPEPQEPIAKRYTVNNFSLEALGEVLIGNTDGVLAFSDEIHGLLMMAQKPGNEGLNDFLLSGWNGDGAYTFDRIGRGLRRIEHVCVSVLGGIQPGRLIEHVIGATHGGAGDSGLVQRFQLMVWPDLPEAWEPIDRKPDGAAQEAAYRVFERVVRGNEFQDLDAPQEGVDGPDIRRFDAEAQLVFNNWYEGNERLIRGHTLPTVMESHLAKYRSLVPSLALIFAIADGVTGAIPAKYVKQAIGWANYLRLHAERVYACTTRPDTRHARALLAKIMEGVVKDCFKPADVYLKGWSLLDVAGTAKAVEMLCDLRYLARIEKAPGAKGGRPSVFYRINPKIISSS